MLFPEEHAPHLKKWIVKRLENTSDADPDVLADYVLALLRHDGDITDVRKLCEEEIPDFLKEDSPLFVNDVFETIASRSYLPGVPPPPRKYTLAPTPGAIAQPPSSLYYDDSPMDSAPGHPPRFQNGSRKRGYNDWDDPNAQNGRDAGFGGRAFKQPRRGGRGGRMDDMNNFRGGALAIPPYPPLGQPPSQGLPAPTAVRYFDPKAMEAFGMSLAAGHPMPEFLTHDRGHLPPKKRKMCRDWEKKGYCQRGSNCMFQHSNDPVYPPLPGGPFGGMQPLPQPSAVEEYDPANALMPEFLNGLNPLQFQPPLPHFGQQQRHRGGRHQNRQKKAPFSADGPVLDRTKSTIVVENIPEESFDEDQVKHFFSQFGNILEVTMKPYKRLAIVKFDNWNAANAAYQSPKVIFDNRFVKVFWHKDEESTSPASASGAKKARPTNGSSTTDHHDAGPEPEIDMEEFAKQQEEKQKAFEEKIKKREELERQHEELEKRQKELKAKQLEETAKLNAKLTGSNGIKSGDNEGDSKKLPVTQTDALRAQLAALEAEARQMGLDPDDIDAPAPWPARGGYGGRGRGSWRGAASPYTPRGRGSYRGRANVHAAYAAYSLDNRPKKVVLTRVDFTVSEKDETLRQYLFGIGEFTDIQTTPVSTEITFKDRKTAEKFFNSVLLLNKEIPGLDGPVELAWAGANGASGSVPTTPGVITPRASMSTTTPTTFTAHGGASAFPHTARGAGTGVNLNAAKQKTTTTTTAANKTTDEGEDGDAANGTASSDKDVHILLERPPADQNEMDYEVADDGQWGY